MSLSGLKDVDREVLKHIDDEDLLKICQIDKKTWNQVCDDDFLRRRLSKYPGIVKYKRLDESWKQFFLRVLYYIGKIKEKFQFSYTSGDFKKIHEFMKNGKWYKLLLEASKQGDLALVKYAIERGAFINHQYDHAELIHASQNGHLEVVKYLTKETNYANASLRWASDLAGVNRHSNVVEYLDGLLRAEATRSTWNFEN